MLTRSLLDRWRWHLACLFAPDTSEAYAQEWHRDRAALTAATPESSTAAAGPSPAATSSDQLPPI